MILAYFLHRIDIDININNYKIKKYNHRQKIKFTKWRTGMTGHPYFQLPEVYFDGV